MPACIGWLPLFARAAGVTRTLQATPFAYQSHEWREKSLEFECKRIELDFCSRNNERLLVCKLVVAASEEPDDEAAHWSADTLRGEQIVVSETNLFVNHAKLAA